MLCLAAACGGDDDPAGGTTVTSVALSERVWVDPTRSAAAAPERVLRVLFWRPEPAAARPLLVMAHGFGGLPEKFSAFADTVARAGYVVAAPAFPLTNENTPGGHESHLGDFFHQPADLSFVLTQILAASATAGDELEGTVDADRVAVLGHSLGGLTAIGLTRGPCCRDQRFSAAVLFAALTAFSNAFGGALAESTTPTLVAHGIADRTVAYAVAPAYYQTLQPPRLLLGLEGVGHSEALESQTVPAIAARAALEEAVIAFLDWRFRGDGEGLTATLESLAGRGHVVEAELE